MYTERNVRENRLHATPEKPFSYYPSRIPEYFPHVPLHCHPEMELDIMLSGSAFFSRGEERVLCRAGDILLFMPDELHAVYPDGAGTAHYETLVFSRQLLGVQDQSRAAAQVTMPFSSGAYRMPCPVAPDMQGYAALRRSAEALLAAAKLDTPQADLLVQSELLRMVWLLFQAGLPVPVQAVRRDDMIRQAVGFMQEHYAEPLTVADVAKQVRLSESCLMHSFRRATGVSVAAYIIQLRLRHAREALADTDGSVAEICYASGFRNLSNFNRLFREVCGCTPGAYRKQRRQVFDTPCP